MKLSSLQSKSRSLPFHCGYGYRESVAAIAHTSRYTVMPRAPYRQGNRNNKDQNSTMARIDTEKTVSHPSWSSGSLPFDPAPRYMNRSKSGQTELGTMQNRLTVHARTVSA